MSETAEVTFDVGLYDPESVLAAAHVLARRARVSLEPDGKGGTVARVSPPELAETLRDEAAAQELRRRVAADNRRLREYIVTQSLLAAGGPGGGADAPAAGPEEQAELERLIAEAEREIAQQAARFAEGGGG